MSLWQRMFGSDDLDDRPLPLPSIPLLDDLDAHERRVLQRALHVRRIPAGETLFRQGDPAVGLFLLLSGHVAILREPEQRVMADLQPGAFFGEIAPLHETVRTATACARTEAVVAALFESDLDRLLDHEPRLAAKLLLAMARDLSERLVLANADNDLLRHQLQTLNKR